MIGGEGGRRQLLIIHTFIQVLGIESYHPNLGCSVQGAGPIVLYCSLLLKPISPAHSVYQAFDPFVTRSTLPLKLYAPESHSLNPASGLWVSYSLCTYIKFSNSRNSIISCTLFCLCVPGLSLVWISWSNSSSVLMVAPTQPHIFLSHPLMNYQVTPARSSLSS